LIVGPEAALITPSAEEIVSRWPGMSTEEVDALIQDYDSEAEQLRSWNLDNVFERVGELVQLNDRSM